ncbi:MAG: pantoate--beta-alanine ligase [Pseudomonadales bacterium]
MKIFNSIDQFRLERAQVTAARVGFVPTMGALHKGHAALIERSVKECDFTVVSVYVNAAQFDNADDLSRYPETLEQDAELVGALGVDIILAPTYEQMYPDDFRYRVVETDLSGELCGKHRDGHFTGVLTVVLKLLNIVRPDRAYFGEKDFQQYRLIEGMARAFFLDTEIVPCETVREHDGLALSSRNLNLDSNARALAPLIYEAITSSASDEVVTERLARAGFDVDYVMRKFGRRFVAARIGKGRRQVRLIDNVPVPVDSKTLNGEKT